MTCLMELASDAEENPSKTEGVHLCACIVVSLGNTNYVYVCVFACLDQVM